jgi:hypothetical protein
MANRDMLNQNIKIVIPCLLRYILMMGRKQINGTKKCTSLPPTPPPHFVSIFNTHRDWCKGNALDLYLPDTRL